MPLRIHEGLKGGTNIGFAPPFAPEFVAYIGHLYCSQPDCKECAKARSRERRSHPESRQRTSRAFHRLRRVAPREFDVLYSVARLGYSVEETARRLTEDNIAKGRPARYNTAAITLLLVSGIDKVAYYWSL